MASPLWKEGWREVPLTLEVDDGVIEGLADLVFRDGPGYTVVDFKSDGDRPEYRHQLTAYAQALGQATGCPGPGGHGADLGGFGIHLSALSAPRRQLHFHHASENL